MNLTPDSAVENEAAKASNIAGEKKVPVVTPRVPEQREQEAAINEPSKNKQQTKILGLSVPSPINNLINTFSTKWDRLRQDVLIAAPAFVLNHSSNVIGALQLTAEMFFQKSSGVELVPKEKRGNPLNYLIEPPKNILTSAFKRSKSTTKLSDMLKPSHLIDEVKNFTDLERATRVDSQNGTVKLINRWSVRSGLVVFVTMSAAALLPDVKDSVEDTQKNAEMAKLRPLSYLGMRIKQAVWFPFETVIQVGKKIVDPSQDQKIGEHKRQFAGLGYVFSGLFSLISGFRQVEGKFPIETQAYRRNRAQMLGGAISSVAGYLLLTGIDNQQGWSNWGTTQVARLTTLPNSIMNRFKPSPTTGKYEQGAEWYLGASLILQVKNIIANLIGGAEKRDGKLIDHKAIRVEAIGAANLEKARRKEERKHHRVSNPEQLVIGDQPSPMITNAAAVERAMPERVMEAATKEVAAVGG